MNLLADALRLALWLWSGEEKGHAQLEEEGREEQGQGVEAEMSVLSVPSSEEIMRLQVALDNSERTVGELRAVNARLQQTILQQNQALQGKEQQLQQLEKALQGKDQQLQMKNQQLLQQQEALQGKDTRLLNLETELEALKAQVL